MLKVLNDTVPTPTPKVLCSITCWPPTYCLPPAITVRAGPGMQWMILINISRSRGTSTMYVSPTSTRPIATTLWMNG